MNPGMIERVRGALRRKPLIGVVVSIAVHAALVLALIGVHPARTPMQKRGDALIVELPNLDEAAARGTPGPQADAPLTPAPPAPAPKAPPTRPAPPSRPTPPVPPRPPMAARPAPAQKPEPRAVASAPQPPPAAERGDMPTTKSAPQPAPEVTKPEAPKPSTETATAEPTPLVAPGQVAMVPPTPPDIRSALRRGGGGGGTGAGGAGGSGTGRGGIIGEPIPLDSKDPDFSDYLERVRQLIKQNWGYPCVKNPETHGCDYKSARLVVIFGILKQGPVQFVEIQRASGWAIYDDYAVNAIKLASPFPPVPPALMARVKDGSTGVPIRVNFTYFLETGITNVIR
jgi:TonB family protein